LINDNKRKKRRKRRKITIKEQIGLEIADFRNHYFINKFFRDTTRLQNP